jgi:hypothetical protein
MTSVPLPHFLICSFLIWQTRTTFQKHKRGIKTRF